ncbi:MAG TPA: NYN domain-containing protein [Steroidobacteraceae bacterium]
MRTAIYIDGFNLYYWLKPLPYRWINLRELALRAITKPDKPAPNLVALKYFTARVRDTADDPRKSTRQDVYIQALKATIPELSIYYGEFRRKMKLMPRVMYNGGVGPMVHVWHTEEKGSDVNLAVELLNDAWADLYDVAIVVSNDSDLVRAVRLARARGKIIGALVRGDAEVNSLKSEATFIARLKAKHLFPSLLPRQIPGTNLRIPEEWERRELDAGIRRNQQGAIASESLHPQGEKHG